MYELRPRVADFIRRHGLPREAQDEIEHMMREYGYRMSAASVQQTGGVSSSASSKANMAASNMATHGGPGTSVSNSGGATARAVAAQAVARHQQQQQSAAVEQQPQVPAPGPAYYAMTYANTNYDYDPRANPMNYNTNENLGDSRFYANFSAPRAMHQSPQPQPATVSPGFTLGSSSGGRNFSQGLRGQGLGGSGGGGGNAVKGGVAGSGSASIVVPQGQTPNRSGAPGGGAVVSTATGAGAYPNNSNAFDGSLSPTTPARNLSGGVNGGGGAGVQPGGAAYGTKMTNYNVMTHATNNYGAATGLHGGGVSPYGGYEVNANNLYFHDNIKAHHQNQMQMNMSPNNFRNYSNQPIQQLQQQQQKKKDTPCRQRRRERRALERTAIEGGGEKMQAIAEDGQLLVAELSPPGLRVPAGEGERASPPTGAQQTHHQLVIDTGGGAGSEEVEHQGGTKLQQKQGDSDNVDLQEDGAGEDVLTASWPLISNMAVSGPAVLKTILPPPSPNSQGQNVNFRDHTGAPGQDHGGAGEQDPPTDVEGAADDGGSATPLTDRSLVEDYNAHRGSKSRARLTQLRHLQSAPTRTWELAQMGNGGEGLHAELCPQGTPTNSLGGASAGSITVVGGENTENKDKAAGQGANNGRRRKRQSKGNKGELVSPKATDSAASGMVHSIVFPPTPKMTMSYPASRINGTNISGGTSSSVVTSNAGEGNANAPGTNTTTTPSNKNIKSSSAGNTGTSKRKQKEDLAISAPP